MNNNRRCRCHCQKSSLKFGQILFGCALLFPPFYPQILSAQQFIERIRIQFLLPPAKHPSTQARDDFARAMGPRGMAQMRQVRADLVELRRRLMATWERQDRFEPGALLAEAMAMARQRKANPDRLSKGSESVSMLNGAIRDFLFQSDILLSANQTGEMLREMAEGREDDDVAEIVLVEEDADDDAETDGGGRRRRRRQAQTGLNFPRNQWNPARPVPFIFDPKLGNSARKAVRQAVQFWTAHTCLSFVENGAGFPRVKIFSGGGCFSQVGKAFHQREQVISLGRGCEQFGIAAHELGHTLGFFHGQARADRDQFVNIVYSNLSPQMAGQFAKQNSENNNNFGVKYDYGSIMHYSDTDSTTSRVTMLAKESVYQHTMGNNVAPSFLDVLEMNLYYKCTDRCKKDGANCTNGGYRHPRNCSMCLCPSGFGGFDCSERGPPENGAAPAGCGETVEASEGGDLQELSGNVSAVLANGLSERHSICHWHIRAPPGKRVQLRVKSVFGACSDGCFYGGTELKTNDLLRTGARVCCRSDIRSLGLLYSSTELAVVSVFSQYKQQGFVVQFRAVDSKNVPPEGVTSYDNLNLAGGAKNDSLPNTKQQQRQGGGGGNDCKDIAGNCFSIIHLCENILYRTLMARQCARTCKVCGGVTVAEEGNGKRAKGKCGGGGANDHQNCATWAKNGFCSSAAYSAQIKREICPQKCGLC
uniref:Zinc metalloproteinase n=1 Tax=Globodera rostochiensis TaxID=31243 RepID=A0A914HLH3_GLORO